MLCSQDFASNKMNGDSSRYDKMQSMLQGGSSEPHNVSLEYLRNITNNFSDERLLGQGGFGTVYKGLLRNGETIAVKKFNSSLPGAKDRQFDNEANHLMRFKHANVVQLVGWCSETENVYVEYNGKYIYAEKSERLLCLEYMPKGNLRGYLSDEFSGLGWDTRYKIIEGICYGLRYLHEECQINAPIIHMDMKPTNILLDNNMVPKIADFGLSRLFSEEKTSTCTRSRDGTLGYMSPEYINRGLISTKSDIFGLGVIIIEIVTGRRDYPDETGTSPNEFIEKVVHNWTQRKRIKILFGVSLEVDYRQIRRCLQIGLDCVKIDRFKRPTISEIIKTLHGTESEDSSNIKRVHGPHSGKRERNCREISWVERPAKKYTPGFSTLETFSSSAAMLRSLSDPASPDAGAYVSSPRVMHLQAYLEGHVARVVEVMKRSKKCNPVMVGDTLEVNAVVQELVALIQSQRLGKVVVISFPKEFGDLVDMDRAQLTAKIKELGEVVRFASSSANVVVNLGNLQWLVEERCAANQREQQEKRRDVVLDTARGAVAETARILNLPGEGEHRVWVIGTATCATYMKCQVYHPELESKWDLQAMPTSPLPGITRHQREVEPLQPREVEGRPEVQEVL